MCVFLCSLRPVFPSVNLNSNLPRFESFSVASSSYCFLYISFYFFLFHEPFIQTFFSCCVNVVDYDRSCCCYRQPHTLLLSVMQLSMLLVVRAKYFCLSVEFNFIYMYIYYIHSVVVYAVLKGYSLSTLTHICTNAYESARIRAPVSACFYTHTTKYACTIQACIYYIYTCYIFIFWKWHS